MVSDIKSDCPWEGMILYDFGHFGQGKRGRACTKFKSAEKADVKCDIPGAANRVAAIGNPSLIE